MLPGKGTKKEYKLRLKVHLAYLKALLTRTDNDGGITCALREIALKTFSLLTMAFKSLTLTWGKNS